MIRKNVSSALLVTVKILTLHNTNNFHYELNIYVSNFPAQIFMHWEIKQEIKDQGSFIEQSLFFKLFGILKLVKICF